MKVINFPSKRPPKLSLEAIAARYGAESITVHYRVHVGFLVGINFKHSQSRVGTGTTFTTAMKHAMEQCNAGP